MKSEARNALPVQWAQGVQGGGAAGLVGINGLGTKRDDSPPFSFLLPLSDFVQLPHGEGIGRLVHPSPLQVSSASAQFS